MSAAPDPPKPGAPPPNPAFAAMGLPRLRAKLPSRNWSIFLTFVAAVTGTITYDRYHAKQIKKKWTSAVSHLASEPLAPMQLPRKVTVYLSSPPGDGIQPAREHFREYVKPVLNAAAVDFDVVEGRRPGELSYKVAEEVRKRRRGEDVDLLEEIRRGIGMRPHERGGVVVVGRHAWKEYCRGLQEGWLGPLQQPVEREEEEVMVDPAAEMKVERIEEVIGEKVEGVDKGVEEKKRKEEEVKKKKNEIPKPLLRPEEFANALVPREMPEELEAAGIVGFPHILGFLNTPIRMYRFVNRRHLADKLCREAAAVALGFERPFDAPVSSNTDGEDSVSKQDEINAFEEEEKNWPKRVWNEDKYKGVLTEGLTVDDRIRSRLRRFYIPAEFEPKDPSEKSS